MAEIQTADFGGYATKANVRCSDGRTITPEAFKHMDGLKVPMVWMHDRKDPENVLGHVLLEHRADGMYARGYFNNTPRGRAVKTQVQHKDLDSLSIWANSLVEKVMAGGKNVIHGMIREVSVVLAGANPEAKIDFIKVAHSDDPDDFTELTDEAVIQMGEKLDLELQHADEDESGETLQEAYDRLPDEHKEIANALVKAALDAKAETTAEHSDTDETDDSDEIDETVDETTDEGNLNHQEGTGAMTRNVFEQNGSTKGGELKHTMTPDDVRGIVKNAIKGGSLKAAVDEYALEHGVENIEILFPDHKTVTATPEWNKRRTEWVARVLNGVHRTAFSRIKSVVADITMDEARAKGYITGNYKKEEWISVSKRTTGPTTVYKKQKLDRDDIIDITDFDIVAWLWGEIRLMLEEEIARAILLGDGRDVEHEDKIKDPMAANDGNGIRSIVNEHELYMTRINVNLDDTNSSYLEAIEAIVRARRFYKGSGRPTFWTTEQTLTEMLLLKDESNSNRRLYKDEADLAAALRVESIVAVEPMEDYPEIVGILVNLSDYNVGTDRGGEIARFDDFDIDYNQYKYLMETRLSGALIKIWSAQVIYKTAAANVLVQPTKPTFVDTTGVVTIPTKTGVVYKDGTGATLTSGAQTALDPGETLSVKAEPASGYFFATNADSAWTFKRPAA